MLKQLNPWAHQQETTQCSGIRQGDIVQVLKTQNLDRAFDVIIADPPYNIGKDFGNDSDQQDLDAYLHWSDEWIGLCLEALSDNGVMYIYGFSEILARIAARYPLSQQRWLVWHYTNKATPASQFWQRSHESILCLWKTGRQRPTLEIDQIREPYSESFLKNAAGKVRIATPSRFGGAGAKETIYNAHENGALPRDVIKVPALAGGAGASERWFLCHDCGGQVFSPKEINNHRDHRIFKHPTQKPFALTHRLLLSAIDIESDNKGRVLIPFAGSGSECVVAQELGIDYFATEINRVYVDFARKWLVAIKGKKNV
ncbi:MAG: DNA-methyltransferase [Candidatus Halichondribacter symbioticus]